MLLLAGLVPATTNAWAPSRTGGTSKSGEDKDKDKDKDGDGEIPLDRSYDMNVLVIKYFPLTPDGENIDTELTGVDASYEDTRQKTIDITNNLLVFIEEASRYLGYEDASAEPALSYSIVDTIEHEEGVPIAPRVDRPRYPDYNGIIQSHDICNYVYEQNVREVWLWAYQFDVGNPPMQTLQIDESKMSGPFGDISNSFRYNDMPTCNNTYRIYTFNYAPAFGTFHAFESWSHQIEAELDAVDMDDIFRSKWQGPNYPQTLGVDGRCGSNHNPPNAEVEYDRANPDPHPSDCLDWDPDGLGELSDISCENWGCDDVSDTDNPHLNYQVWNWQNLPGINNDIEFQGEQLRNWWDIHGDFDNVMTNNRRLTVS